MATPPVPDTWATGSKITAAKLNTLRDALRWCGLTTGGGTPAPYAHVSRTAALSPATAVVTVVPMDTERDDTDTMHDLVTNPSRVIAQTAGEYAIRYGYGFVSNATGRRLAQVLKNAAGVAGAGTFLSQSNMTTSPSGGFAAQGSFDARLIAGDYIELFVEQQSGAALAVSGGESQTFLEMEWKRP
jgi:hypothetical protein